MAARKSGAPVWRLEGLQAAIQSAGLALWSWNVDSDEVHLDEQGYALWGIALGDPVTLKTLSQRIHPPDLDLVTKTIEGTRVKPGPYEVDFRIARDDKIRWIVARGLGGDEGLVGRDMFGVFMDITDRKQAEEARYPSGEHRGDDQAALLVTAAWWRKFHGRSSFSRLAGC